MVVGVYLCCVCAGIPADQLNIDRSDTRHDHNGDSPFNYHYQNPVDPRYNHIDLHSSHLDTYHDCYGDNPFN